MPLAPGARLGPYEILAPLGAGGMGEVYKARDTRLDRSVAVKVLPSHVAGLPELRQRLEREARAVSNLSHPNICALFDVGHQDGVDFLVMEFLEGETLAARLERGALPTRDLLRHAIEIADALDRAHRQGVLHRDLKPGNVMLTKTGAKLLDFGLAKSVAPPAASNATASPTLTTPLTAQGSIIGTFQYMAPEQLEGGEADVRSDIFAFGAVLYEMATGRRAFEGKTQASLAASILKEEPRPVSALVPATPPALERIIRVCLAKDPGDRWQTAHDLAAELRWIAEAGSGERAAAPSVARRRGRERLAWAVVAVLAAATLALSAALWRSARPSESAVWTSILPPEDSIYRFTGYGAGPVEVSPDGLRLVFVADGEDGEGRLWIRSLGAPEARVLAGTEGATYPFWSPDGRFIGFFAEGKLKKIEASGGPPLTLCDALDARGGSWSRDGVILFEPHWRAPLHRVSASGGASEQVTTVDAARKETTHRWPWFLPDGRHFLFLAGTHIGGTRSEVNAIFVGSLDSKETKLLVNARSNAAYAQGRLLFVRERTLMAQPFDPGRLEPTGDAVPLAENVAYDPGFFRAIFSVGTGMLAFQEGSGVADVSQLAWFHREGRQLETIGEPGQWWIPRVSHDGRRLAVGSGEPGDLWLFDLSRGAASRFTFDPADDSSPVWSPDDGALAFSSFRSGFGDLFRKVSSGTGSDDLMLSSDTLKFPTDWSRDGRLIVFNSIAAQTRTDIWIYSIEERKATPFLASEFDEGDARLSPDGRWIAYTSSESGREDVYVQSFPGPGGKWQVSTAGGSMPLWSPDGTEIFYLAPDRKLMAVEVKPGAGFETAAPRALFETRIKGSTDRQYDVSPDGRRFLINAMLKDEAKVPLTLVQYWTAALAR